MTFERLAQIEADTTALEKEGRPQEIRRALIGEVKLLNAALIQARGELELARGLAHSACMHLEMAGFNEAMAGFNEAMAGFNEAWLEWAREEYPWIKQIG